MMFEMAERAGDWRSNALSFASATQCLFREKWVKCSSDYLKQITSMSLASHGGSHFADIRLFQDERPREVD